MMRSRFSFAAVILSTFVVATVSGCGTDGEFPWDGGDVVSDAADTATTDSDSGVADDHGQAVDSNGQDISVHDTLVDGADVDPVDDVEPADGADGVDIGEPELPVGIVTIDEALADDFMQPNRGLNLKIIAPLLATVPDSELTPSQIPWVLESELILPSGAKINLDIKDSAFMAEYPLGQPYNDSYVYISTGGQQPDGRYSWDLKLYPMLSTFSWMKTNGIDTVSGDYFSFIIYRSGYFNLSTWVSCPVLTGASPSSSGMKVYFDEDTLTPGKPLGLMVNSYVTDNRRTIAELAGVADFHEACYCYDVEGSSFSERACTVNDIDQLPGMPQAVAPEDGAEGESALAGATTLQWASTGDADGGNVTYDVYFGTEYPATNKVLTATTATSWVPALTGDTTYFWRVEVTDDEGNTVVGPNWTFNTDSEVPELVEHDYLIVVDKRLKGLIDTEIDQYVQDVINAGKYFPAVRWWMPGSHQKLKEIIKESYDKPTAMRGVFLIGNLPSAWYEQDSDFGGDIGIMHEEFPTELYFQDMDGVWTDADGNGMYDGHPEITLELFSSRLVGDVEDIRAYLNRNYLYRNSGSFFAERSFFSFVDDDWNGANATGTKDPYTTDQTWGLGNVYGSNYTRREWSDNTSKQDYLDVMANGGAEFVYQWIHSDPQRIYFDDNFSPNPDNILSLEELVSKRMQGSFYNLFDCSISRYTEPDGNMASEYLFGDKGLATIGSTKTGGIFNPEILHGAILGRKGFGEALRLWFNDTWANRASYGYDVAFFDGWWLGMMNQGDPLIELDINVARVERSLHMPRKFSQEELRRLNQMMYRRAIHTKVTGYQDYIRRR